MESVPIADARLSMGKRKMDVITRRSRVRPVAMLHVMALAEQEPLDFSNILLGYRHEHQPLR